MNEQLFMNGLVVIARMLSGILLFVIVFLNIAVWSVLRFK